MSKVTITHQFPCNDEHEIVGDNNQIQDLKTDLKVEFIKSVSHPFKTDFETFDYPLVGEALEAIKKEGLIQGDFSVQTYKIIVSHLDSEDISEFYFFNKKMADEAHKLISDTL